MSRKTRIEFDGAFYHIFQRGNNCEYIFKDTEEKMFFLRQIYENKIAYDYILFAYVIMNNHYHFLIKTNKVPIHKIMHSINNAFSKFYNKRHERTGHVFEERYNSRLIDNDAYLVWLVRYIHRNPIKANICSNANEYNWSSDLLYRNNIKSFIDIDFLLNSLSSNRIDAIKKYCILIDGLENSQDDYTDIKNTFLNPILLYKNISPTFDNSFKRKSLPEILCALQLSDEDIILIKCGSRKRSLTPYKVKFLKIALEYKYTIEEIGEFLGISQSGASRILINNSN